VATAVGDVAELLDVDVDQFTGAVAFIAADGSGGGAVQVGELGDAVTGQDPVDGGRVQPEQVRDPGRPPTAQHTDLDDASFGTRRCLSRAVVGAAGVVAHTCFTVVAVAVGPPFRGRGRDLEAFRGAAQ